MRYLSGQVFLHEQRHYRDCIQSGYINYSVLCHTLHSLSVSDQLPLPDCAGKMQWPDITLFNLVQNLYSARFLNTILAQVGTIYRAVILKRNHNISYTSYISSFASFAWMDMCTNMLIAAGIIGFVNPDFKLGGVDSWLLLLVMAAIVILVPVAAELVFRKTNFRQPYLAWVHSKLGEVLTVTVKNIYDGVYLLKIVGLGLLVLVCTMGLFYICFIIFGIDASLPALAMFYVLLKISTYFNLTPGNIGIQELAYGFLGEQMGIGMAQGVLVSAFMRVAGVTVLIALGLIFGGSDLLRHRKDYTELKE